MLNSRHRQDGFSHEALLALIVVALLIVFAVWRVYQTRPVQTPAASGETTQLAGDAEAATWQAVAKGSYTIKIPDGWNATTVADSTYLYADDLTYNPGTPATIHEIPVPAPSDQIHPLTITQLPDDQADVTLEHNLHRERYQTPTLGGYRYYKKHSEVAAPGINENPGLETYTYVFKKDGQTTLITYNIKPGEFNQRDLVERMVNTLELK